MRCRRRASYTRDNNGNCTEREQWPRMGFARPAGGHAGLIICQDRYFTGACPPPTHRGQWTAERVNGEGGGDWRYTHGVAIYLI